MPPTFSPIPILRSFDETKAREFYIGFLGFTVDWQHRFEDTLPLYMQISRGGMRLHLSEHHGDITPGTTVFVETHALRDFHAEITSENYTFNQPGIDPAPWGGIMMETTDPFANRLRFWEDIT